MSRSTETLSCIQKKKIIIKGITQTNHFYMEETQLQIKMFLCILMHNSFWFRRNFPKLAVMSRPQAQRVSGGQIYRFCHKLQEKLPCIPTRLSVCDKAVHQTSPRTPFDPCKHLHTTSGTCRAIKVAM